MLIVNYNLLSQAFLTLAASWESHSFLREPRISWGTSDSLVVIFFIAPMGFCCLFFFNLVSKFQMCIPSLCLRLSVFVLFFWQNLLHYTIDFLLCGIRISPNFTFQTHFTILFCLLYISVWILFMLFLMSFNNVGSPSITNSDEGQNCLSFMLAIALHWVTSWSAQIPRLRIFMPLAGSRGLRQFANKAGSSSTICPLYGWYQTMKFNLTMVTARELSICKKSWFLATRGDKIFVASEDICKWMDGDLALAGKKINSDITSNKLPSFFLSSYSSMMQISPKFDIVPCSLFSTKWKHQYKWLWVKDRVKVTSQHWATETVLVSNFTSNPLQPHFKRLKDKRCTHLL